MSKLTLSEIVVGERHRKDLGDVAALVDSIRTLGLLQPLVVTRDKRLVAGARRLEAVRRLGWTEVDVCVVDSLDDALLALRAEQDENTCRKDFTIEEKVCIAEALRRLEEPKAKERQRRHGGTAPGRPKNTDGNLPPVNDEKGKTRDKVAEVVGMSGRNLEKATEVVEAGKEDPTLLPFVDEMNKTGNVDRAHKKVREKRPAGKKGRRGKQTAAVGHAVRGACKELNRMARRGELDTETVRLVAGILSNREQKDLVKGGANAVKDYLALRNWTSWAESVSEWTDARWKEEMAGKPPTAGPLPAKNKERVLAALSRARDAIAECITTIEGWPSPDAPPGPGNGP
jgi:ParB-like chromosome segregation protein Spo0J